MSDPEGRSVGATFLRNNLNKRSMCVDLKSTEGRQLVLDLAPRFDIFAENFKAGAMDRMGLGYDDIVAVHPRCIYASVSGFGNSSPSPYRDWPAFAPIVEAMSGVYEMKRIGDLPPVVSPVGALGDIGAALYTSIGILAALRDRDQTGRPAYVDVAMLDSVIAMTDIVTNYWSMGVDNGDSGSVINHGFRASDGWFVMQVARVHVFERSGSARRTSRVGNRRTVRALPTAGCNTSRTSSGPPWRIGRPGGTAWRCAEHSARPASPPGPALVPRSWSPIAHVAARHMLVGIDRTDGVDQPVLVPGNPALIVDRIEGGDRRIPWLGEHTDEILRDELGLTDAAIERMRSSSVVG